MGNSNQPLNPKITETIWAWVSIVLALICNLDGRWQLRNIVSDGISIMVPRVNSLLPGDGLLILPQMSVQPPSVKLALRRRCKRGTSGRSGGTREKERDTSTPLCLSFAGWLGSMISAALSSPVFVLVGGARAPVPDQRLVIEPNDSSALEKGNGPLLIRQIANDRLHQALLKHINK